MTRILGYARDLLTPGDAQEHVKALRKAGASKVYVDTDYKRDVSRPELDACLRALDRGDTLLIPSAIMLSHSVEHFVSTVAQLRRRDVCVRSLIEPSLSTTADHEMQSIDTLDALDALRSSLVSLRTRRGLDAAIASGRKPGRPRVMTEDRMAIARELRAQKRSYAQIGRALGVSEAAVRRAFSTPAPLSVDHDAAK